MEIPRQAFNINGLKMQLANSDYSVLGLQDAHFGKLYLSTENGNINLEVSSSYLLSY
jgi:hypothetical protein